MHKRSVSAPAYRRAHAALRGRDLLSIRDLTSDEIASLIAFGADIKREPDRYRGALAGATLAMLFEKPSLRTRVSFDVASHQLGAHAIYLAPQEVGLGRRETAVDVARTLEHTVDAIMIRTFAHSTVEQMAQAASIPVINGLSDFSHPCQALADYLTIVEAKGSFDGLTLAFVGDGNNVANSLIFGSALLGVRMVMATPPGYEPRPEVLRWAREHERQPGTACRVTSVPGEAVEGADVVYTDTWVSMGQEAEADARRRAFAGFQVTEALFARARPDAVFMHCLPAHRGEEVEAAVIDSPHSIVFTQAANRLHTEKALLIALLRGDHGTS